MNKLKENLFTLSVAGLGVVLVVLAYLFVVSPLLTLGERRNLIDAETTALQKLSKKKRIPIAEYRDKLEKQKAVTKQALDGGMAFYADQAKAFHSFFDDAPDAPPLNDFVARYNQELAKLIDDYRAKFGITVDPDSKEGSPPKVSRYEVNEESRVPAAMKEFWIAQEVFLALEKLDIRGLQDVDFSGRLDESKEPPPYRRHVRVVVHVDMPFSQIENFLTELYASKRVPFLLEELSFLKEQTSLGQFLPIDRQQDFKDQAAAKKESYDALIPQPTVRVTIKLLAVDWKGEEPPAKTGERTP